MNIQAYDNELDIGVRTYSATVQKLVNSYRAAQCFIAQLLQLMTKFLYISIQGGWHYKKKKAVDEQIRVVV